MADNVTIELAFRQQVAADAHKLFQRSKAYLFRRCPPRPSAVRGNLIGRQGGKNRYMKCEAIDARALVRTRTTYLCLDSQFNLSGLIIPIRINIYDAPVRESSRRHISDLTLHDLSCPNCTNKLSVGKLGSDQRAERFF